MGNSFSSSKEEERSEEIAASVTSFLEPMKLDQAVVERCPSIDSTAPAPSSPASSTSDLIVLEQAFPLSEEEEGWVWKVGRTTQKKGTWVKTETFLTSTHDPPTVGPSISRATVASVRVGGLERSETAEERAEEESRREQKQRDEEGMGDVWVEVG
ncbi:hypothetical protein BDY24DRAFT_376048 [Mrakia frigida]|uniref:uncharacterized protein n=1 Tax=Mrakia frigida TaxID=29902 RepID=UPI003FCC244A